MVRVGVPADGRKAHVYITERGREWREAAGLDPEPFAGHSLRAGFVTTAAGKGIPFDRIMRQTRHKNERVLMTYIRPATIFRHNPTEGLGDEEDEK